MFLFSLNNKLYCQKDTLFFDKDWKETTSRSSSEFYRTYSKSGTEYKIYDYFKDGKVQMITSSSSINPLNKNGLTLYYNKEGFKTLSAHHENNKPTGHWVWYFKNESDSTVADYRADGTKNYTRICECERSEVYTMVEEMPEYPGGIKEMMLFIQKNIKYPLDYREKSIGGKVFIRFVVDSTGSVVNPVVIKSTGIKKIDEEGIRVVNSMPKWKPGTQNKRPVNVYFNLPLNFSCDTPYFIFNQNNTSPAYLESKNLIEKGNIKETITLLKKEAETDQNIDLLYNLGVAYFLNKEQKESCRCFENIWRQSNDKIAIVTNSKNYLEKYCNK